MHFARGEKSLQEKEGKEKKGKKYQEKKTGHTTELKVNDSTWLAVNKCVYSFSFTSFTLFLFFSLSPSIHKSQSGKKVIGYYTTSERKNQWMKKCKCNISKLLIVTKSAKVKYLMSNLRSKSKQIHFNSSSRSSSNSNNNNK